MRRGPRKIIWPQFQEISEAKRAADQIDMQLNLLISNSEHMSSSFEILARSVVDARPITNHSQQKHMPNVESLKLKRR
jgi:hypothetical protein